MLLSVSKVSFSSVVGVMTESVSVKTPVCLQGIVNEVMGPPSNVGDTLEATILSEGFFKFASLAPWR